MAKKKYIYFPVVRYRYKHCGRFVEHTDDFDNLDQVYLFIKLYIRNCCWVRVCVLDDSVDRDRFQGHWIFVRNAGEFLIKLPLYLQEVRKRAIYNARLGKEYPY